MQTLAGLLHGQGQTLTVSIGAKISAAMTGRNAYFDYPALAQAADHLFVMAWDLHWATSPAGPISDVTWVSKVVGYIATVPNSNRFIIGTQLYGFDWPAGGAATPLEFDGLQALIAQVGATPAWDPVAQEPHFTYTDGAGQRPTPSTSRTRRASTRGSRSHVPMESASACGASDRRTRPYGTTPPCSHEHDPARARPERQARASRRQAPGSCSRSASLF